jgi:hypothetical protein
MSITSTAEKKERPAAKVPSLRESDGSVQLVGYLGWRLILDRIGKKNGAA